MKDRRQLFALPSLVWKMFPMINIDSRHRFRPFYSQPTCRQLQVERPWSNYFPTKCHISLQLETNSAISNYTGGGAYMWHHFWATLSTLSASSCHQFTVQGWLQPSHHCRPTHCWISSIYWYSRCSVCPICILRSFADSTISRCQWTGDFRRQKRTAVFSLNILISPRQDDLIWRITAKKAFQDQFMSNLFHPFGEGQLSTFRWTILMELSITMNFLVFSRLSNRSSTLQLTNAKLSPLL